MEKENEEKYLMIMDTMRATGVNSKEFEIWLHEKNQAESTESDLRCCLSGIETTDINCRGEVKGIRFSDKLILRTTFGLYGDAYDLCALLVKENLKAFTVKEFQQLCQKRKEIQAMLERRKISGFPHQTIGHYWVVDDNATEHPKSDDFYLISIFTGQVVALGATTRGSFLFKL